MKVEAWIALATLIAATVLFITRVVPLAMTALSIPVVLYLSGVIDLDQALVGFSSKAVIAIGAVMVIGAALKESGVATIMARGIQRAGGKSEGGLIVLIMLATSILAAFMNNTAVVAILLPAVAVLSTRAGVAPSRLMMPMAFAAVLGGTISLIGTAPNFIVADYFNNPPAGVVFPEGQKINVFDFAAVGIPITVAGILYMVLVGRRFLPTTRPQDAMTAARRPKEAAEAYRIREKLFKVRVAESSKIAGRTIADVGIRARYGLGVVMVRRPLAIGERWFQPEPDLILEPGDLVYVEGEEVAAWEFCETELLQFGLPSDQAVERLLGHGTAIAEVTISPHSDAIGRTFRELDFRKRFGLNVLGLWRRHNPITEGIADVALELGDAMLVSGSQSQVRRLERNPDYVVLTDHSQEEDVTRAPLAFVWLLAALLPPVLWDVPLPITAIGAAVLMVATRCIGRSAVVRSIDWTVLALLVGTLPLGAALMETGVSEDIAGWFEHFDALGGIAAVYAALFVFAAILSVLASNAAAAAIMAPVAVLVAQGLGLDARTTLLAMAYGCSCNFLLPFAQCNLLVMAPGGYGVRDYVKAGAGLSIVMGVTTVGVLWLLA